MRIGHNLCGPFYHLKRCFRIFQVYLKTLFRITNPQNISSFCVFQLTFKDGCCKFIPLFLVKIRNRFKFRVVGMASQLDDLTVNQEENGRLVVKELSRLVLSTGNRATIIFKFQLWDASLSDYGPVQVTINRYQKIKGEYQKQSQLHLLNKTKVQDMLEVLQEWLDISEN